MLGGIHLKLNISDFDIVGNKYNADEEKEDIKTKTKFKKIPYKSILVLSIIVICCIFADFIMTKDPTYMDLANTSLKPGSKFYFGTDTMGRDIFSMIWYGGRISLFIGILSTIISTSIAILYGTISACSNQFIDDLMMRITEMILSIPSILIIIFIQGIIRNTNIISLAIVIGITSWMNIAKIIRAEVRQIKNSEYIIASKTMGASFFFILKEHMVLNFLPAIMFMVVTNIGAAIGTEATLSFLGIGLPIEIISWGSMLSLAEGALLSNLWWIILIPGIFLVLTLVSITNIGNYLREKSNKKISNL